MSQRQAKHNPTFGFAHRVHYKDTETHVWATYGVNCKEILFA